MSCGTTPTATPSPGAAWLQGAAAGLRIAGAAEDEGEGHTKGRHRYVARHKMVAPQQPEGRGRR